MNDNSYLGEVLEQQKVVESALKRRVAARKDDTGQVQLPAKVPQAAGGRAIDYRITGWWRYKTVYVVHTRAKREKPVTIGMGPQAQAQTEMQLAEARSQAAAKISERAIAEERARREVENLLSDANVRAKLIQHLPEIAARLPQPKELRTVSIGSDGPALQLTGLYEGLMAILDGRKT